MDSSLDLILALGRNCACSAYCCAHMTQCCSSGQALYSGFMCAYIRYFMHITYQSVDVCSVVRISLLHNRHLNHKRRAIAKTCMTYHSAE